MAQSKASLETAIRNQILDFLTGALSTHFDTDVMDVSSSELTMPVVDAEGNEKFALIKVSIPRGTRNGDGGYEAYDGYAEHDMWELTKADKADKANKRKEKAERAEREKERKRAAKKVIKDLNTKGFKALVTEPQEQDDPNQFLPREVEV